MDPGGMVYVRKDNGGKGALRLMQQLHHDPVQACAAAGTYLSQMKLFQLDR